MFTNVYICISDFSPEQYNEEPEKEQNKVSVAIKQKKNVAILAVKNSADEPIYGVKIKSNDGTIKYVKARGWDRDRVEQNTILIKTDDRPIFPNKSLIIILITDNSNSSLEWFVFDKNNHQISSGVLVSSLCKKGKEEAMKWNPDKERVIGASGIIFDNGTTTLDPWYRFVSTADIHLGNAGEITLLYLDKNGKIIGETGFNLGRLTHGPRDSDVGGFALKIPYLEGINKFIIKRGDQILAERIVSTNHPHVRVITPNGGEVFKLGDTINVKWESSDPDGDKLWHAVSLSNDEGQSWHVSTIDFVGNEFSFKTAPISTSYTVVMNGKVSSIACHDYPSHSVLVRVTVTDGVNTSEDVSDSTFYITK